MRTTQLIPTLVIAISTLNPHAIAFSQEHTEKTVPHPCPSDHAPFPPPPDEALRELVTLIPNPDGLPIYLRPQTDPIFYFNSLPNVDYRRGMQQSEQHYSSHEKRPIGKALFDQGVGIARVYTGSNCHDQSHGVWIQFSPLVSHPNGTEVGFFVRTTPGPCLPLGGRRYWATVEQSSGDLIRLSDLGVIEF